MTTIKSYSDLEQSRKLAEILPIESADMYYNSGDEHDICFGSGIYKEIADWICEGTPRPADIPCWSLAALLGVLPAGTRLLKSANISSVGDVKYHCDFHRGTIDEWYDNPVDACVAMIEKLHELEML